MLKRYWGPRFLGGKKKPLPKIAKSLIRLEILRRTKKIIYMYTTRREKTREGVEEAGASKKRESMKVGVALTERKIMDKVL